MLTTPLYLEFAIKNGFDAFAIFDVDETLLAQGSG